MKVLGAAALAMACAVGFAPQAAAGDKEYLDSLQTRLAAYTPQQLLTEGYRVCAFLDSGRASPDAVPMVVENLQTSTSIAVMIVTAAVSKMPC